MGISSDFQRVVVARLRAIVPDVPVYDDPDERAPMPYISVGPSYWHPENVECVRTREETLQIDVWASSHTTRAAVKDIADQVSEALEEYRSELGAALVCSCRIALARVMTEPNGEKHGVVQIAGKIERAA